jgi:hypothetical protein
MTGPREDYFARVRPLLGDGLRSCAVSAEQLSLTARVVELLLSCMLEEVHVCDPEEPASWPLPITCRGVAVRPGALALEVLRRHAAWKNEFTAVRWRCGTVEQPGEARPQLHLSARLLPDGSPPHVLWDEAARRVTMCLAPGDLFSHQNLSSAVARRARDLLLGRRGWPPPVVYHGNTAWPFAETRRPVSAPQRPEAPAREVHLLVVGCGSVGSELVRLLAGPGVRWTLVDGGDVSVFNPQRQWFGTAEIGAAKVEALARRLAPSPVRAVGRALGAANSDELAALLDEDRPDLALLTTGTHDHAALAQLLWRRGVPCLSACAYPQARFFEINIALPGEGTPCLCCFRGRLYRGPESTPPISDELARFLYREISPAERERAYVDLVAEPATRIETSRVADVLAQCALEALTAAPRRAAWFRRLLDEGTTCLLGSNTLEQHADGTSAYGMNYAGQVVRLGLEDVAGVEEEQRCGVCGRRLQVAQRVELPAADDAQIDDALLAP